MGLFDKVTSKSSTNTTVTETTPTTSRYTAEEYEFLFMLIKNSTFKGENLELLFSLTLKLQEDYLAVKNKKD